MTNSKPHVLLVEDEEPLRWLARKILTDDGYQVTSVENGRQAWELLQTQEFDLLVTDIQMPEMTGNELVERVLRQNRRLPILMLSGYNPQGSVPEEAGFLAKPFTARQLLDEVAALHHP